MDAEIVTRGSRIPKICALCVFILAVFFYAGLCSGDFFKGADFVRADPLEGVADLPGAVRALSFALVPPLLSFASIFALSFTPYRAQSAWHCTPLPRERRLPPEFRMPYCFTLRLFFQR